MPLHLFIIYQQVKKRITAPLQISSKILRCIGHYTSKDCIRSIKARYLRNMLRHLELLAIFIHVPH